MEQREDAELAARERDLERAEKRRALAERERQFKQQKEQEDDWDDF